MVLKSEQELFPKIQARLATVDPNNRTVVHIFKLKIKKDGVVVKTMMLDLVAVKFYEGDAEAECTLIIDDELLCDIAEKKVDSAEALKEGKFEVEGNLELIKKLKQAIFA